MYSNPRPFTNTTVPWDQNRIVLDTIGIHHIKYRLMRELQTKQLCNHAGWKLTRANQECSYLMLLKNCRWWLHYLWCLILSKKPVTRNLNANKPQGINLTPMTSSRLMNVILNYMYTCRVRRTIAFEHAQYMYDCKSSSPSLHAKFSVPGVSSLIHYSWYGTVVQYRTVAYPWAKGREQDEYVVWKIATDNFIWSWFSVSKFLYTLWAKKQNLVCPG